MFNKVAGSLIGIIIAFTTLESCQNEKSTLKETLVNQKKENYIFETLINKKVADIRMPKTIYPNIPLLNDSTVSLSNFVFSHIEISTNNTNYYHFYGNKPFYQSEIVKINGFTKEDQRIQQTYKTGLEKTIDNFFIVKNDTLYYLRSFFNKQDENLNFINSIRLIKPIATYKVEDSLYRHYTPLLNSRLKIEKSKNITKKANSNFNNGTVTSSWATSKIHLKLGAVNFYSENRFGSSSSILKTDDIKHSLAQFILDSIQIDNHNGNRYYYFQYYKKPTKHGYIPYFKETEVLN